MWIWRLVVLGLVFGLIAPMGVFAQTRLGVWELSNQRRFGSCSLSQPKDKLELVISGPQRYPSITDLYPRIFAVPIGDATYSIDGGPQVEITKYRRKLLLTMPNALEALKRGKRLDVFFTTDKGKKFTESFDLTGLSEFTEIFEEPRCLASLAPDWQVENRIGVTGAWGVYPYSPGCYLEQAKAEHRIKIQLYWEDPELGGKEYQFLTGHGYSSEFQIDDGPFFQMVFDRNHDNSLISGLTVEMLKRGKTLRVREPSDLSSGEPVEVLFDLEGFDKALSALAPCRKMRQEAD